MEKEKPFEFELQPSTLNNALHLRMMEARQLAEAGEDSIAGTIERNKIEIALLEPADPGNKSYFVIKHHGAEGNDYPWVRDEDGNPFVAEFSLEWRWRKGEDHTPVSQLTENDSATLFNIITGFDGRVYSRGKEQRYYDEQEIGELITQVGNFKVVDGIPACERQTTICPQPGLDYL